MYITGVHQQDLEPSVYAGIHRNPAVTATSSDSRQQQPMESGSQA
jgi:hypothetical protein